MFILYLPTGNKNKFFFLLSSSTSVSMRSRALKRLRYSNLANLLSLDKMGPCRGLPADFQNFN